MGEQEKENWKDPALEVKLVPHPCLKTQTESFPVPHSKSECFAQKQVSTNISKNIIYSPISFLRGSPDPSKRNKGELLFSSQAPQKSLGCKITFATLAKYPILA